MADSELAERDIAAYLKGPRTQVAAAVHHLRLGG